MLYSYYLNHNYGKVEVSSTFEQHSVGVINAKGDLEHLIYDGEVTLKNALIIQENKVGYLTSFFGSPGYRQSEDDSWQFVSLPNVMACIVIRGNCYSILDDDTPYVCTPCDPNYLEIKRVIDSKKAPNSRGSVVSMESFRDRSLR